MLKQKRLAAGTNGSIVVERCQVCEGAQLDPVIFIGYLPPVEFEASLSPPLLS